MSGTKIRITAPFRDIDNFDHVFGEGEVVSVSDARAKHLVSLRLAELVGDGKPQTDGAKDTAKVKGADTAKTKTEEAPELSFGDADAKDTAKADKRKR